MLMPEAEHRQGKPMDAACHRRTTCRLCGGTQHERILQLAPSPIADAYIPASRLGCAQPSYPMDLFLCTACGHAQLLDVIDPNVLYRDYIYVTTSSLGLSEHFQGYAAWVMEALQPRSGGLVVDIGSNDGTLLRAFQARGMRGLGIEPAQGIAQAATAAGVETLPDFFSPSLANQVVDTRGSAQVITMNNLFANIDDLDGVAEGVRALLAPDGVFVFETFYFLDFLRNLVFDFMYHEHLSYFTIRPLQRFFWAHGLELIDVVHVPTKGGSVRCTVQRAGGPRPLQPSVARAIEAEEAAGIQVAGPLFQDFRARIEAQAEPLRDALGRFRAEGRRIVGYGASATTTTLIHHFGITGLLDALVDDNPAKQGTFSPGCHLPVHAASTLAQDPPDVVVILAWRYWQPILQQHAALLARGTRFLVPLPAFREIVTP